MASTQQLKDMIDLHDLAGKIGLQRQGSKGNYHSPHHKDKSASLSISKCGKFFNDFSGSREDQNVKGSCIDLIMYVEELPNVAEAMRRLHDIYGLETDKPNNMQKRERGLVDIIADNVLKSPKKCGDYLMKERCISIEVIDRCIANKTLGYNDYTNPKYAAGEPGHGGPGVSFIARDFHTNFPVAIDTRYIDKELNGGVKSNCQGDKFGNFYVPDPYKLKSDKVKYVFVVESPINALTVESFSNKDTTSIATLGAENDGFDWTILRGKFVILAMDNDLPDKKGRRPGQEAAWRYHEQLTAVGVPCLMLDQMDWGEINDVNDYAIANDLEKGWGVESKTRYALKKIEKNLIPGLWGKDPENYPEKYNRRLVLPFHDWSVYWRYKVEWDFTSFTRSKVDHEGNETTVSDDVCGFRISALSRVNISSVTSTMTGEKDLQPRVVFVASIQTARHKTLIKEVFSDRNIHSVDKWRSFGAIYKPAAFSRMLNIWERATDIGSRDAVNFVGLCWKNGKPQINDGVDCYFNEPEKQCPYHNFRFPSGSKRDAKRVIAAYQETFKENAAAMLLVWGLGAQLKAYLGFWPHMMLQADKGSGKSVLCKRLERTLGFTMFSGQSLQTEFRLLTSVSHTSHPVGWEEISARKQDVIDKATSLLQESYQYSITRRGGSAEMTEYLVSAPVLLAGEDVPVKTLLQKLVRTEITNKQGPMMPEDLPRFPMREWINFLADYGKQNVLGLFDRIEAKAKERSAAVEGDSGAARIIRNYAAIQTAWMLVCEFAGIDTLTGDFGVSCIKEMNLHIQETESDREPWVWIMDIILGEIDRGDYRSPYKYEVIEGDNNEEEICLTVRVPHIMQHLSQTNSLKEKYNAMPVKSDRVLKKQLKRAGVIHKDGYERVINNKRVPHCTAISVNELERYGLRPVIPEDLN